jgi:hypothetical protein
MATQNAASASKPTALARLTDYPASSLTFDTRFLLLSLWLVSGLYLDGWAHNHIGDDLDPFFTPWHAVMYSGYAATALFLGWTHWRNQSRGHVWGRTVPAGYGLSLVGLIIFGLGGMGDFAWHMTFGIERGAEVFLSPTHHLLILGIAMIASGPFRAAWRRPGLPTRTIEYVPMIGSATLTLSVITFILQGVHPFIIPIPLIVSGLDRDWRPLMMVTATVIQTLLLIGMMLLMIRRWKGSLPIFTFPALIVLNALAHTSQTDLYFLLPASLIAALVAGILYWRIRPALAANRPGERFGLRLFAGVVPIVLYTAYFATLLVVAPNELRWRIHAISGVITVAGFAGWLLTYALFPAPIPDETTPESRL